MQEKEVSDLRINLKLKEDELEELKGDTKSIKLQRKEAKHLITQLNWEIKWRTKLINRAATFLVSAKISS